MNIPANKFPWASFTATFIASLAASFFFEIDGPSVLSGVTVVYLTYWLVGFDFI